MFSSGLSTKLSTGFSRPSSRVEAPREMSTRIHSAADDTPLADLVEGLEGKRVIVRAHRHGGGLLLHDIEPDAQTTGSTGAPHAR
jgi:hypothetical protein